MDLSTLKTKVMAWATPKNLKIAAAVAVVVVLLGAGAAYHWKKSQPQSAASKQQEVNDLVTQVSKLMLLPPGETPTIATVSDVSKLKGQAFFANAETGDKVLIFASTRQAILFRPSANRIIEVAPLVVGNPPEQTAPVAPVAPTPAPATHKGR